VIRARVLCFAAVLVAATVMPAAAELPEKHIPGESPAGPPQFPTPTVNPGRPTPKPQTDKLRPSNPNLPQPEPVAPKQKPSDAPNLPGSGRQEPVPGS
jgi:hypothetical protein